MIYVECKRHLTLVKALTNIHRHEIRHAANKGDICNILKRRADCKALLDEDPQSLQPHYIREAKEEDDLSEHGIKVLYHKASNNYLVLLCPTTQEWVLRAASEANIDVRKYGLPDNARKLHQEININLDRFENLLEDLKDSNRLKILKKLLERQ